MLHALRGHGDGAEHPPVAEGGGPGLADGLRGRTVTTSLRIILLGGLLAKLKEVLEQVNTDDGLRGRLMTVGWLLEGATALTPTWSYYRWDPAARKQVKDERPPLAHDRALHCVEALQRTLCDPAVLLRFRAAHRLGMETHAEVVPFKMAISLRARPPWRPSRPSRPCATRGPSSFWDSAYDPERMQKTPLAAELEEAYLSTSFTDWTRRKAQGSRGSRWEKPQQSQQ